MRNERPPVARVGFLMAALGMAFGTIVLLSLQAGCNDDASPAGVGSAAAESRSEKKESAVAYHDEWRKLWEDHITWTRIVILGILDDIPGTATFTGRLLQNYEDMEESFAPYFPEEDVEELGDLIKDHLVVAAQILTTVHDGGDPTASIATWRLNGTAIARKMSEMNPEAWDFETGDRMWQEHLTATLQEAVAHAQGNFPAEVAAYDDVHDMALEMADFFSNGVIRQNKQDFRLSVCVP